MTEHKCVRTYDNNEFSNILTKECCVELNPYLENGWKVVFVTPKTEYTEYIIEREIDNSRMEVAGAEPREKENAELKTQIEKMKCCGNCEYRDDMTSYCKKHKKEICIFMIDTKCNDWKLFD